MSVSVNGDRIMAVSYTHLDVYKRQVVKYELFNCLIGVLYFAFHCTIRRLVDRRNSVLTASTHNRLFTTFWYVLPGSVLSVISWYMSLRSIMLSTSLLHSLLVLRSIFYFHFFQLGYNTCLFFDKFYNRFHCQLHYLYVFTAVNDYVRRSTSCLICNRIRFHRMAGCYLLLSKSKLLYLNRHIFSTLSKIRRVQWHYE